MIVHPTHGHYTGTLANGVVHYWQQQGKRYRFRPIHRLDRETSGVLAIAKNPYAHQQVSEQLQAGDVDKQYVAIVRGRVEPPCGTIDAPIDRDPDAPHLRIVTAGGYRSVTHYETIAQYEAGALVALRLETGRTHQIRVHMTHLGYPLYGDGMYGVEPEQERRHPLPSGRHALHARTLSFVHPHTKQPVVFEAPLPDDMQQLLSWLQTPAAPSFRV